MLTNIIVSGLILGMIAYLTSIYREWKRMREEVIKGELHDAIQDKIDKVDASTLNDLISRENERIRKQYKKSKPD